MKQEIKKRLPDYHKIFFNTQFLRSLCGKTKNEHKLLDWASGENEGDKMHNCSYSCTVYAATDSVTAVGRYYSEKVLMLSDIC